LNISIKAIYLQTSVCLPAKAGVVSLTTFAEMLIYSKNEQINQ
jgi:hypothetical protein